MVCRNTHREPLDYFSTQFAMHFLSLPHSSIQRWSTLLASYLGEHSCKHLICIYHLTEVLILKDYGYSVCFLEPRKILTLTPSGNITDSEGFLSITAVTTYSGTKILTFSSAVGLCFLGFRERECLY